jgi:hypothetical protein
LQVFSNDSTANPLVVPVRVTVIDEQLSLAVNVEQGWNLVSAPLLFGDFSRGSVYPTSVSQLFRYLSGSGYQGLDTLIPGEGYWLKFPASHSQSLTGVPVAGDTIGVLQGWNLIGSISYSLPAADVTPIGTAILSPFYGYGISGFGVVDTLLPGKGSWVKVSTAGQLVLTSGGSRGGRPPGQTAPSPGRKE